MIVTQWRSSVFTAQCGAKNWHPLMMKPITVT